MAMPKSHLSPAPWEQDDFLQVKMEEEEASLSQVQESSFGHTFHPEAARLRFHFCFEEASSPHEALAQLRELCCQWLRPEVHSKEQMLELLVLEQFLGALPPEIQSWVGAQCPKSVVEASVLVEGLTWALDKRGWPLGSELTDTSYKQSGSEESEPCDRATKILGGGTPPGAAFGGDCESLDGPERQARLSGETWVQSVPHQMDFGKTSGPHKDAPRAQPSCEAGALGDSPHMWPDLTSREKTPSEERWDPPDGCGTEPPGTYSGRKPPTCGEWGKTLRSHQKSQACKTPHTCSECGKAFGRKAHLAQHRVVHTGAKSHACMECGKAFGRLTHLSQHRRVHTGEKPCASGECGKAFRRNTHLSQHRRTHTGERPYACDKAFCQSTHLTQHRRVHTGEKPYECGACGRAFSNCSALVRHLRVNSGEKPCQCRECPKAFAQSSSLLEHQRVHTGEKPYRCVDCGKAFSCSSALMVHLRLHVSVLQ
uniref:Zinc finger and SCAN domain containing 22 n=1 Tax=Moschus moschiferus TaxID=68415 RepID=A0A8C6CHZ8_MOSMO